MNSIETVIEVQPRLKTQQENRHVDKPPQKKMNKQQCLALVSNIIV